MTALTPLRLARSRMMLRYVFFAALLMSVDCIEDESIPTACTNYAWIRFNPKFLASLPKDVVMFVLAHEVCHILFKHGLRRNGRDAQMWNIACDFFINRLLKRHGFTIWDQCYYDMWCEHKVPPEFDQWSSEAIYTWLMANMPLTGKDGGQGGQGGLSGDVGDPRGLDAAERSVLEHKINQKIAQAATQTKLGGKLPGDLEQLIQGILHPPLSWQELLREFMTRLSQSDESWSRRNRRFANIYLPARHSVTMGEMVGIGDTSGSLIGSNIFAQTGAEINAIREQVNPERVRWIWADDAECSSQQVFEPDEDVVLKPVGGGGTDMRRPLKFVEQYEPVVVVLVTDGYTPWPEEETPFPLIILCNTDAACPEWATTIRIKGD